MGLYTDPDMSRDSKAILCEEMGAAHQLFTEEEFQAFMKTLPGFEQFWQRLRDELNAQVYINGNPAEGQ